MAAAAAPRPRLHTDYPRGSRGVAATPSPHGLSTWQPRRRRDPSSADSPRDVRGRRYGPDGALWALRDECASKTFQGYKYDVCFFKHAKQGTTRLGDYESSANGTMTFTHGEHCWNGPARSLTVTFACGASTKLLSVDEPQTCVYAATVSTPAVCGDGAPPSDCSGVAAPARRRKKGKRRGGVAKVLADAYSGVVEALGLGG